MSRGGGGGGASPAKAPASPQKIIKQKDRLYQLVGCDLHHHGAGKQMKWSARSRAQQTISCAYCLDKFVTRKRAGEVSSGATSKEKQSENMQE